MSQEPNPKKQKTSGFFGCKFVEDETPQQQREKREKREKEIGQVLDETLLRDVESERKGSAGRALKESIVEYEKDPPPPPPPAIRGSWGGAGI